MTGKEKLRLIDTILANAWKSIIIDKEPYFEGIVIAIGSVVNFDEEVRKTAG